MNACHMCKGKPLYLVIDLGEHPPSDAFIPKEQLGEEEYTFPLRLMSCGVCGLLQIDYRVDPEILYQRNYLYESSTTATGREHFTNMAHEICERFSIPKGSLAVDIGSNVGVLLAGFKQVGMSVLGVDPAPQIARQAILGGIPTVIDFFSKKLAEEIVKQYGKAMVITGTNVFAHLHDLDDAVYGMKELLDTEGVIAIEAPYAVDLVLNLEYDTVYLEHIGYLSVKPMQTYFKEFGLELFDVAKVSIHGGSLRYYVGREGRYKVSENISKHIALEEEAGLYDKAALAQFAKSVEKQKSDLHELLLRLKQEGKKVVGLSAPAKGTTLLNFCGIDSSMLDFVTEKNQSKIGCYSPGMHVPIVDDEALVREHADYALILAWNFADEIMRNQQEFVKRGGKFIIPIPTPRIV